MTENFIFQRTSNFLIPDEKPKTPIYSLKIHLSTFNVMHTAISVAAYAVTNFDLDPNREYNTSLDSNTTLTFRSVLPPPDKDVKNSLFHVTSKDDLCMMILIQKNPPLSDAKGNLIQQDEDSIRQRVTIQAGVSLSDDQFPTGVFITFKAEDDCRGRNLLGGELDKKIKFSINENLTESQFRTAIAAALTPIILGFDTVLTIFGFRCYQRRPVQDVHVEDAGLQEEVGPLRVEEPHEVDEPEASAPSEDIGSGAAPKLVSLPEATNYETRVVRFQADDQVQEEVSQENIDTPVTNMIDEPTSTMLQIPSAKSPNFKSALSMSIFFAYPVYYLMSSYHNLSDITGDYDMCTRNFLCAHTLFGIQDVNHILSNVGYVGFGLLFSLINYLDSKLDREPTGFPNQSGINYFLGMCLVAEGILSGCYHLCPTEDNLQFDIVFIYICLIFVMLKNHNIISSWNSKVEDNEFKSQILALVLATTATLNNSTGEYSYYSCKEARVHV